ncbi:MAG: NADH-quinone oxidoreductase subunit N [candidate division Zixibacteria bacterium RBG_16_40_9]|nr:MAG: NADH-quinone oxidoreductase subunit N [candidate division Zixibacteria bacterium RBG_16_40_9]
MPITIPSIDFRVIMPEIVITLFACLVMLLEPFLSNQRKRILPHLSWVGVLIAAYFCLPLWNSNLSVWNGQALGDNLAVIFKFIFLVGTLLTILISHLKSSQPLGGEYYSLILFSTLGMMIMGSSSDLIVIFLGLEVMSIALYVLAGFNRTDLKSNESAMKYFLMGAFSTGFLLYGIALIYGTTGSTNLNSLVNSAYLTEPLFITGLGLLLVGLGFKVAAVPFHMWVPDVYEGAPTPITAFMAAGPKAAGFAALLRVFLIGLGPLSPTWITILWILAVLTMTLGNVFAIAQMNIKRMLAYSSIAHAGYILITVVAGGDVGVSSAVFYLLVYSLMTIGSFAVIIALGEKGEKNEELPDYRGLGLKYPLLGVFMAVFMVSLSGIPPTAGFVGKFYIFSAAVKNGYLGLAIIGVLNSLVSVYYYLRIVVIMFMQEAPSPVIIRQVSWSLQIALWLTTIGILGLGIFPDFLFEISKQSFIFSGR